MFDECLFLKSNSTSSRPTLVFVLSFYSLDFVVDLRCDTTSQFEIFFYMLLQSTLVLFGNLETLCLISYELIFLVLFLEALLKLVFDSLKGVAFFEDRFDRLLR